MAARMLLKKKGVPYTDIALDKDPDLRREIEAKSGRRTVPMIFIGEQAIGGFDELDALEKSGELDEKLSAAHN